MLPSPPIVLTIAGFDPSSGAGITADVKTIAAHGCYGVAVITALTVQSSKGVRQVQPSDPSLVASSLEELTRDVKVSAVHVGMLGSGEVAARIADFLERVRVPNLVLDTVLRSSSGMSLVDVAGTKILAERLLPLAAVITPNTEEAAALTGRDVGTLEEMKDAARQLHHMGVGSVVITGGQLERATDLLSQNNGAMQTFTADRLNSLSTHGTGCAFSTALACHLALGRALGEAVLLAKAYVTAAIRSAYPVGKGKGPLNHMYRMRNHPAGLVKKASGRT
ncbi:MAG: bifunctional hydroxymethylpyrimidine kinase/phosphomethylpyrimidine kinase [Acidobacteria bacterium]|nr:bifunctional hydroxymethylpyrimidine kinase/phosphomethylpyrimidine kinase [Acidobacteriota bacterium]